MSNSHITMKIKSVLCYPNKKDPGMGTPAKLVRLEKEAGERLKERNIIYYFPYK